MAGCLVKIKEIINELSFSEKKVAQYILDNSDKISDLSIGELAQNSGTSEATIVRLCKLLDFNGYKDFKVSLTKHMSQIQKDIEFQKYTDVKPGDSLDSIIKNISYNNKKSIDYTLEILSGEAIKKSIDAIIAASRVDFYAVGICHIIALDAMQKFSKINKIASAYADPHMQVTSAANLRKGDVAVAISYSGETQDTYESIKLAKESRATTISITKFGQNPLSEMCDINLFVSAPDISIGTGAMSSRIAQLNLIDILFAGVTAKEFNSVEKYLNNTGRVIKRKMLK